MVTIENSLTRDLGGRQRYSPALDNLSDDFRGVVQALPLLGSALTIATPGTRGATMADVSAATKNR